MDDLALQVAVIDVVEVDQRQGADTGGCQVHGGRTAQTAQSDNKHMRFPQFLLTLDAEVRQHNLAAVVQQLFVGKCYFLF